MIFIKRPSIFLNLPIAVLLLLVGLPAMAGENIAQNLNAYFSALEENGDFSGVVRVDRDGEIVFHKAFGFSDYAKFRQTDLDTRYPIASLTKTFVSGAILVLVDEGKLSLDDPLSNFFPDVPRADDITVRFLLLHASGLENPDYLALRNRTEISPAELTEIIGALPLRFEPGTDSQYSNAGYNVLTAIIEKISGQKLDDFLKSTFFEPLGMDKIQDLKGFGGVQGQAKGYLPGPPPSLVVASPVENYSLYAGSGSLISAADDLTTWLGAVENKTHFNIFDPSFRWPYGWGKAEVLGHKGLEQSGAIDGYRAAFLLFPDEDLKVVVLSNINSDNWIQWANDAATIGFGGEATPHLTPRPVPGQNLDPYPGSYDAGAWILHIKRVEGHLWMFFDNYLVGKYLVPLGNSRFTIAGGSGTITFQFTTDGPDPVSMEWDYGGGTLTGKRINQ